MATVIVFIFAWRSIQSVATGPVRSTLRNSLITASQTPHVRASSRWRRSSLPVGLFGSDATSS